MELTINLESYQNYTLMILDGDINTSTIQILENALGNATRINNSHIVIDCSLLKSISSDGLKLLLHCQVQLAGHFYLSLYNVPNTVASLMELSGITYFIQMNTQEQNQQKQVSISLTHKKGGIKITTAFLRFLSCVFRNVFFAHFRRLVSIFPGAMRQQQIQNDSCQRAETDALQRKISQ